MSWNNEVYSTDSSNMISNFTEVLNFNRFICNQRSISPAHCCNCCRTFPWERERNLLTEAAHSKANRQRVQSSICCNISMSKFRISQCNSQRYFFPSHWTQFSAITMLSSALRPASIAAGNNLLTGSALLFLSFRILWRLLVFRSFLTLEAHSIPQPRSMLGFDSQLKLVLPCCRLHLQTDWLESTMLILASHII